MEYVCFVSPRCWLPFCYRVCLFGFAPSRILRAFSDDLETARESNLFKTNPDRFLAVEFVQGFPVHAAYPFSLAKA